MGCLWAGFGAQKQDILIFASETKAPATNLQDQAGCGDGARMVQGWCGDGARKHYTLRGVPGETYQKKKRRRGPSDERKGKGRRQEAKKKRLI